MKRLLQVSVCLIVWLVLCLPLAQKTFELFPRMRLANVHISHRMPKLTLESFLSGDFQGRFEKWFLQTHGFWGQLVRLNNQLNYQVFQQIDSQYGNGNSFMVGDRYTLFQTRYLRDFNGDIGPKRLLVKKTVQKMKRLSELLEARGKAMIVLISANKLILYPEIVPARYRTPSPNGPRTIELFKEFADKFELPYFETTPFLQSIAHNYDQPFFAKPAAHWNTVAACEVGRELYSRLSEMLQSPIHEIGCGPEIEVKPRPYGEDHDLADVINVWNPDIGFSPTPYVKPTLITREGAIRPSVLYVGTSFVWGLLDVFEPIRAYSEREFFYYGNTNHHAYIPAEGKISKRIRQPQRDKRSLADIILEKDIVIFEANEARLENVGFSFLDKAIKSLRKQDKEFDTHVRESLTGKKNRKRLKHQEQMQLVSGQSDPKGRRRSKKAARKTQIATLLQ